MATFLCPTCQTRTDPAPHTTAPSRCGHFVLVAGECNVVATRALAARVVYSDVPADGRAIWPLITLAMSEIETTPRMAKSRTERKLAERTVSAT